MGHSRVWAGTRTVTLLVLLLCALNSCTYAKEEPGLFGRTREPATLAPPGPSQESPSMVTSANPDLPVAGEAIWTSGEGLGVRLRIAVHAVRRIAGGTVLDWSVTPLSGLNLGPGDAVPASLDLGLDRVGGVNVTLIDAPARRVYRPLTVTGRAGQWRCICSPVQLAERQLRVGQTSLLQIVYPQLPTDVIRIDVDVATVPIFWHVPVTGIGLVPEPTNPIDLTRPPDGLSLNASTPRFRYSPGGQEFVISVDEVIASSTFTSARWTIQSLTAGEGLAAAASPPFAEVPDSSRPYNAISASGPQVSPANDTANLVRSRRVSTKAQGLGALECLCSDLRTWAGALRSPGQQVSVVTNFSPLPYYTERVDVAFPGLTTLHDVHLTSASDGSLRSAGPVPRTSGTWAYHAAGPPAGWSIDQWPTPLPDRSQLPRYRATVDELVR